MLTSIAAWWSRDRDFEHEGDDEYPLRDPHESMAQRRSRYISHVADAHHVDEKAATGALRHIVGHISSGSLFTSPTDHGFASDSDQAHHYSLSMSRKLMDPKTWEGRKPENIDLRQPLHATQNFIRPDSVAHNLFHPGSHEPTERSAVGDPDYKPSWDDDSREESESGSESTPEEKALHNTARFMRRHNGRLEVVDGHHRVAADMLLGKTHTRGVMIHERDLGN
ncbi:hypothetical protein ACFZAM_31270 [Streptomyces sp. NPDC008079]|uniref:hypothetical protein n=1 Tax=Streptomyces sp. NPDC008079 TaxID=3364806 RepID=UPI0036EA4E99